MEEITDSLKTKWLGQNCIYLDSVDSTNKYAYNEAENKAPMGTLVVADSQTQGKGRRGNSWESPVDDGLWFSVILRPALKPQEATALTIVTAVGICRGLDFYPGLGPGIKWPNDILIGRRKLCGILSEMKAEPNKLHYAIIGVGLNIRTTELSEDIARIAVGMEEILTEDVDKKTLLCHLLKGMEDVYDEFFQGKYDDIREEWEERSLLMNKKVKVETANGAITGVVVGLSDEGFLRIRLDSQKIAQVISGDITVLEEN
ncbi:MAG: biotin--[acetyl-CoA-carboxylase] ligase [Clostridiales bacterium]